MIKKVKDWLGIEGVKISLDVKESFKLDSGVINGSYTISSQSSQYIESVHLTLKEKYQRGRRKSKLIDEYTIGEATSNIEMPIEKDELIHREFQLEFSNVSSPVERFGDKNFLFKGISSLAKMLKNAKSKYFLVVEVTVKGNKLKPYDKVEIVSS